MYVQSELGNLWLPLSVRSVWYGGRLRHVIVNVCKTMKRLDPELNVNKNWLNKVHVKKKKKSCHTSAEILISSTVHLCLVSTRERYLIQTSRSETVPVCIVCRLWCETDPNEDSVVDWFSWVQKNTQSFFAFRKVATVPLNLLCSSLPLS